MDIYVASSTNHAQLWADLRTNWKENGINIISSWPDLVLANLPQTAGFASAFWPKDLAEVCQCKLLVCYAEPKDVLRGALVEAGCALAKGTPVLAVGTNPGFGTWQYHPLVSSIPDFGPDGLATALRWLTLKAGA